MSVATSLLFGRSLDADQPKYTPESISNLGNAYLINFTRGNKLFEINNHLGNVTATVSDRTLPEAVTGTPTAVRGYTADIVTASDYYPFGMVSRAFNSPSLNYRYGFNGKEVDNEMFGIGNELDYGMRVYDPRVGRFLSVDPLTKSFPWYTPYQYAGNSPISNIDIEGKEDLWFMIPVIKWMATSKLQNEVASVGRLASGQSGDASVPQQVQGTARSYIAANQTMHDVTNAVEYFSRPYEMTNTVASVIFPEAAVLNGIYQVSEGNYVSGDIEAVGGAGGVLFKTLSFSQQAYVNGVLKTVGNNSDDAVRLYNQGVRDFAELEPIVVRKAAGGPAHHGAEFIDEGLRMVEQPLKAGGTKAITNDPLSIWGKSASDVASIFEQEGYKTVTRQSTKGSMKATIIEVHGHSKISQIQIHPGGGRHSGQYYKISTSDEGIIKVVDKNTYKGSPEERAKIIFNE